jgi:hypothetical protein
MKRKTITISPDAADDNSICTTQAATGSTAMTLQALAGTGLDPPAHLIVTCAGTGTNSAKTLAIVGTDRYGQVLTESIAGSASTTTEGTKNFATITSITPSATFTGEVEVGNTDSLESAWIPVNRYGGDISIGCTPGDANMTYAIQHTFDDIQAAGFMEDDADTFVHATLTAETTAQDGSYSTPIRAFRVSITGYSGSESLTITYVQERG